jgi:RNA polymerase sigma-70 factor (ECF subfamily)
MEWVTTTMLLSQLADGDEQAWARLSQRFRTPIVRFVRHLGVPESEAEDVTQEALLSFLDAYRRGRYDREKGRLSSWLFTLAAQAVKRRGRGARRQAREVPASTVFWDELSQPELRDAWDRQWDRHVFERCLSQVRRELRPATVRAFELVALEERRAEEVAAETGLTINAVYLAKRRVLQRIHELQEQHEHFAG